MRSFFTIVGKELLLFIRAYGLTAVVLLVFTADVYIAGSGIVMNAKNVSVGVVDRSEGVLSKKILTHLHQPEFQAPRFYLSDKELNRAIFNKEIMMGLIFASDFEKAYLKGQNPHIDVLLDSTAASQSFMALSYLQNIVFDFNGVEIPLEIKIHKLFNQNATNNFFMALTELMAVTTLLSVILTAVVFSTGGVFLGHLIMDKPFGTVMSGVGVITLAGIVVNNNIVFIDTYNVLRRRGSDASSSTASTARRSSSPSAAQARARGSSGASGGCGEVSGGGVRAKT